MTKGETPLKEQCRYLVRRPNEIFLQPGEDAERCRPGSVSDRVDDANLSQEDLLKQPVHIPHRPLKDPRALRVLDPACGSMHFGLYAFDLLEVIYDEAWELEATLGAHNFERAPGDAPLRESYADKAARLRDVPRLIIERNLHGIDIDPRAVQIAGLSLWLRAQRAWQQQGLKPAARPPVRRSNIVCAEPMPGEEALLDEFSARPLAATPELRLVAQFLRRVFRAMQLAGEAGSLLKIEEEVARAVAEAKAQWLAEAKQAQGQGSLFADLTRQEQPRLAFEVAEITDESFWERAEGSNTRRCASTPNRPRMAAGINGGCLRRMRRAGLRLLMFVASGKLFATDSSAIKQWQSLNILKQTALSSGALVTLLAIPHTGRW